MHAVRMLLDYLESRIREQIIKGAISYDYHASARLDHPEEFRETFSQQEFLRLCQDFSRPTIGRIQNGSIDGRALQRQALGIPQ